MAANHNGACVSTDILPDEQWAVYRKVITEARKRRIRFAIGGAFGLALYTGQWRNTKDLDLYILPEHRESMIEAMTAAGLEDYYTVLPYDRGWIYRGHTRDIIVDAIWSMANQRAQVDASWFSAARTTTLRGETLEVIPPEEMLWQKLYIIQRERCDWPDVLNIVQRMGSELDWAWLIDRMGDDWPVLRGMLSVYAWLAPGRARTLPSWLWDKLRMATPDDGLPDVDNERIALLDSRPWFQGRNEPVAG